MKSHCSSRAAKRKPVERCGRIYKKASKWLGDIEVIGEIFQIGRREVKAGYIAQYVL